MILPEFQNQESTQQVDGIGDVRLYPTGDDVIDDLVTVVAGVAEQALEHLAEMMRRAKVKRPAMLSESR